MNIFNRIVTLLLLGALLALVILLAVFPAQSLQVAQNGLKGAGSFLERIQANTPSTSGRSAGFWRARQPSAITAAAVVQSLGP